MGGGWRGRREGREEGREDMMNEGEREEWERRKEEEGLRAPLHLCSQSYVSALI